MSDEQTPIGYHLTNIARGEFGEVSKIFEEVDEFDDALRQGVTIMALVELSDLIGAIKGWLAKHHPSITIDDLNDMATVTKRVFESGHRESRFMTCLAAYTPAPTAGGSLLPYVNISHDPAADTFTITVRSQSSDLGNPKVGAITLDMETYCDLIASATSNADTGVQEQIAKLVVAAAAE